MPPSLEQFGGNAVSLSTAIEIVQGARYGKAAQLAAIFRRELARLTWTNSQSKQCQRLLGCAFGVEERDFEMLVPLLSACGSDIPSHITVRGGDQPASSVIEASVRRTAEAARGGGLREYFRRQPEVEKWIALHSSELLEEICQCIGNRLEDADGIHRLLLATSAATHDLMAGVSGLCKEEDEPVLSFVGHCVHDIRRSLFYTTMRRTFECLKQRLSADACERVSADIRAKIQQFSVTRTHPEKVDNHQRWDTTRMYLQYLQKAQSEFDRCLFSEGNARAFPVLASILKQQCGNAQRGIPAEARALPWGQITLLEPSHDGQRMIAYTADGIENFSGIAVTDETLGVPTELMCTVPVLGEFPVLRYVISCRIDDGGKVHFSETDRFAPPPDTVEYHAASSVIHGADTEFNEHLVALWENHPSLFATLCDHGPLVCLRDVQNGTVVFCKPGSALHLSPTFGYEILSPEEMARLAQQCHIEFPEGWQALLIEGPREQAGEEEPLREPVAESEQIWRHRIREKIGKRIPSLQWIVNHLKPFGEVELSTKGKGSHGSILLVRPSSGVSRQTIWRTIEGTESISWALLWEFLERLGIDYRSFYESLSQEKRGESAPSQRRQT
ncbi:MAG: hypothetical protein WC840_04450 [Candidatus Peribacteraceae bacterium]